MRYIYIYIYLILRIYIYTCFQLCLTGVIFHTIASTERHAKCLEMVLNHGANVNNVAADNTPVFVFACDTAADNEQMCITLLERGADPNLRIEVKRAIYIFSVIKLCFRLFMYNILFRCNCCGFVFEVSCSRIQHTDAAV